MSKSRFYFIVLMTVLTWAHGNAWANSHKEHQEAGHVPSTTENHGEVKTTEHSEHDVTKSVTAGKITPRKHTFGGAACAVLEAFGGDVQLFNADRTGYLEVKNSVAVPCGAWISVGEGWASLRHTDGHTFQIGQDTFAEIPAKSIHTTTALVLYRGLIKAQQGDGSPELKVQTASASVRARTGSFILVFKKLQDQTDVVSFSKDLIFENRFAKGSLMPVGVGETSYLNFQLERTVPVAPKAFSVASLKTLVSLLNLPEGFEKQATKAAVSRGERKLASIGEPEDSALTTKKGQKGSYERHTRSKNDQALLEHFTNRMVAGRAEGQKILFPDKFVGQPSRSGIQVLDAQKKGVNSEDQEKRRLIEELSQIKAE